MPGAYFDNVDAYSVQLALLTNSLPRLMISCVADRVAISWLAAATDYQLESTPALPALNWLPVTNSPATNSDTVTVTIERADAQKFYRLRKD
jgi:hypothetical protein